VALTNATGIPSRALELPFDQQLEHHIRYALAICEDSNAVRTRDRPLVRNAKKTRKKPWKIKTK
jgi:hypothetical protein